MSGLPSAIDTSSDGKATINNPLMSTYPRSTSSTLGSAPSGPSGYFGFDRSGGRVGK